MFFSFQDLRSLVVDRGLCTGCGVCVGICPVHCLTAGLDDSEEPVPLQTGKCTSCGACFLACPGADVPFPELTRFCYRKTPSTKFEDLGFFTLAASAYATDNRTRIAGASGGVVTALLKYAMGAGIIDCALVAGFNSRMPWRPEARIAASPEELESAAQSKYAMVPTNSLLRTAVDLGYENIGVVGLPCHIHGIRKMQYLGLSPKLGSRIKLLVGLLCGSEFYLEGTKHLLKELCGVRNLDDIEAIQYRGGDWPGSFIVDLKNGERRQVERNVYSQLLHRYRRDRCLMCVDWSSEFADISIGDYWDPQMKRGQELGRSSVLVRTLMGGQLLDEAQRTGCISLGTCSIDHLTSSGGFEQKKHAAAFRLEQRQRHGWPTPNYHFRPSYEPKLG
ncbi:MAG: Coenzyme F420 hydrogenase/dehydrogenase, beta subunit C-terminal domain [Chloroflexi bacterium]|nr:Coenzyme F420 hydrogenase/dehydrogenase, beta subunit C-terminal domain [Chloroflexota bacterium]